MPVERKSIREMHFHSCLRHEMLPKFFALVKTTVETKTVPCGVLLERESARLQSLSVFLRYASCDSHL